MGDIHTVTFATLGGLVSWTLTTTNPWLILGAIGVVTAISVGAVVVKEVFDSTKQKEN